MAKISRRRKFIYTVLAFVLALVAAELVLRLVGWVYLAQARSGLADAGKPTILCLGDSFTFGIGAGLEQSYPAHLQRLLGDDWNVVNGGHPYMDSTSLLASYSKRLLTAKPKIVLLLVGYNNHFRLDVAADEAEGFWPWFYRHFGGLKLVQLLHIMRVNLNVDHNVRVVAEIPRLEPRELDRLFADPANAAVHAVFKRNGGDWADVLKDPATDADTLIAKGLIYLAEGEGRRAEPLFFRALDQRPDDRLALMGAGYITMYRREIVMGFAKEFLDPHRPWLVAGMATVLLDRGETTRAEKLLRETVKEAVWFVDGYLMLAQIYLQLGDPAEALAMLKIAESHGAWNTNLHWLRGEALLALQEWDEAEKSFDAAFDSGFDHPSYYARLRRQLAAPAADPDAALRLDPAAYALGPGSLTQRRYTAYARGRLAAQPAARSSENLTGDLAEMKAVADNLGVTLVLMSYPDRFQYGNLRGFADASGTLFINHVPMFEQALTNTPPDLLFREDGHCTSRGYRMMAENIRNVLKTNGLLGDGAQP